MSMSYFYLRFLDFFGKSRRLAFPWAFFLTYVSFLQKIFQSKIYFLLKVNQISLCISFSHFYCVKYFFINSLDFFGLIFIFFIIFINVIFIDLFFFDLRFFFKTINQKKTIFFGFKLILARWCLRAITIELVKTFFSFFYFLILNLFFYVFLS